MKKTYWWRLIVIALSGGIFLGGWIYDNYLCFANNDNCLLDNLRLSLIEPLVLSSIFFFIVSFFLFFIRDNVFLKWVRFAAGWVVLSAIFIILAPEYSSGVVGNPTKETVSIWMGALFVILSLTLIIYESLKLRKK